MTINLVDSGVASAENEYGIHICADNVSATTGYVLIDVSDTVNFPHQAGDNIYMTGYQISIDSVDAFRGQVLLGFLSRVDAVNGHFRPTHCWFFTRRSHDVFDSLVFGNQPIRLHTDHYTVVGNATDTTFQTDTALTSPVGTSYPGVGDCVMKIVRTAGEVSVGITINYYIR